MMKKNRIIIIDGNNLGYAAFFAYKRLNHNSKKYFINSAGQQIFRLTKKSVGLIYGFPEMLKKIIRELEPDDLFVCWDGRHDKERLKLLPEYKGHRGKKDMFDRKNFRYQRRRLMRLMDILGVKQIYNLEREADDLIYILVRKFQDEEKNKIIVVSRDKDFFQLIRKNVMIYDIQQVHVDGFITKKSLKNPKLFHSKIPPNYGYYPKQAVDYLCLTGDKSDDIPGYPNIGHVRALSFLEIHSSIKKFIYSNEEHSLIDKKKLAELYKRNRYVIGLKLFYNKFLKGKAQLLYYKDNKNPVFNLKELIKFCDRYNIQTFRKKGFTKIYKNV